MLITRESRARRSFARANQTMQYCFIQHQRWLFKVRRLGFRGLKTKVYQKREAKKTDGLQFVYLSLLARLTQVKFQAKTSASPHWDSFVQELVPSRYAPYQAMPHKSRFLCTAVFYSLKYSRGDKTLFQDSYRVLIFI